MPVDFQQPFHPNHETMAALNLHANQPAHELAANLRRAFSGIVAGNVKEGGMRCIEEWGPFVIDGDRQVVQALDALLRGLVDQRRMKMAGVSAVLSEVGVMGEAQVSHDCPWIASKVLGRAGWRGSIVSGFPSPNWWIRH